MTNSAEEEALLKAKEITARLAGSSTSVAPMIATAATTTTASTKTSSTKRKRWGVAPDNVAATTSNTPSISPSNANPVAASAVAHAFNLSGLKEAALAKKAKLEEDMKTKREKRLWISATRERPASFWVNFLTPLINNLLDEVGNKDTGTSKKDDEQEVTICLQGRGSSDRPPLPGIPEEPLHILIKATPPKMDIVEPRMEQFVQDAEHAPAPPIDQHDENQEEESKNNNSALALTTMGGSINSGFKSSLSTYRPATVAQLIGQAHHHQNNQSAADVDLENLETVGIQVPNGMVGFIIGRGGETISSIQARTGAKVQIQKEHELKPGQTLRQITLTAATKEGVMQAKSMIQTMVQDRLTQENLNSSGHHQSGANGAGSGNTSNSRRGVAEAVAAGHALVPVAVPDADVGLIIGKGGSTIQNIQQQTGASIQIPPSADPDNSQIRTVRVTHQNEENAQAAKRMIEDILKTKTSHFKVAASGPQLTIQVMIPDKDVGLCIGRQGCVIREMQSKSGARIQIPGQPTPGQPHRIATVSGSQEGCNTVQQMIERIIVEQSSQFVMNPTITGGSQYYSNPQNPNGGQQSYYNAAGQQGGGAAATGAKDYSAEWAAYYAAQAQAQQNQQQQQQQQSATAVQNHHQQYAQQQQTNQYHQQYQQQSAAQQTAVQQQATVQQATAAATATAQAAASGADAYYEQFFRYAYYYGEDAARKYYGAWSPPVGTPNPYGTNPSGVTAPPAGGNTTTAATGANVVATSVTPVTAVPTTQVKDSSVRKVSNLPAWMTRQ